MVAGVVRGGLQGAQAFVRQWAGTIHLALTNVVRPEMKMVFMSGHMGGVIAHRGV